jgi:hypothetical protein
MRTKILRNRNSDFSYPFFLMVCIFAGLDGRDTDDCGYPVGSVPGRVRHQMAGGLRRLLLTAQRLRSHLQGPAQERPKEIARLSSFHFFKAYRYTKQLF